MMQATEKPLWQRWQEMTPEQREADWADTEARLQAGQITAAQAKAYAEVLRKAAEEDRRDADELEALHRLINAAGCPPGVEYIPWLVKRGFLVEQPDRYMFTPAAMILRGMKGLVSVRKGGSYPVAPRQHDDEP